MSTALLPRSADNRYFVPLSVVVPGYQVPITKTTDKDKATLDVLGVVRDEQRRPVGRIRDTVQLADRRGRRSEAARRCCIRPA